MWDLTSLNNQSSCFPSYLPFHSPHPPLPPPSSFLTESETWDSSSRLWLSGFGGRKNYLILFKIQIPGPYPHMIMIQGASSRNVNFHTNFGKVRCSWEDLKVQAQLGMLIEHLPVAPGAAGFWEGPSGDGALESKCCQRTRQKQGDLPIYNLPLEAGSICQLPFQWVAKASTKPREVNVHFTSYRQAHLNAFLENAICHNWLLDGINKWLSFFFLVLFSWIFFEVLIEFVTILFLFFMFWSFGHKACGFSAPQQGIEPVPPALEGELLTADFQGSPLDLFFKKSLIY